MPTTTQNATVKIPEGVKAELSGTTLTLSGKHGKSTRSFDAKKVTIELKGSEVFIQSQLIALLNSAVAHINNMGKGAGEGYAGKMQSIHSHFPVSFEVKGKDFLIKNFLGEKKPRKAAIVGVTKLEVKGTDVHITGPDKEDVGQTVANIRNALRILKRDSRVFQDGLYVVEE
ncbi:MAG: 50S ribosomal protein L6 [Candidatus Micrarchaeia archaeon]|jgi:large subunit ribosomal protein L6